MISIQCEVNVGWGYGYCVLYHGLYTCSRLSNVHGHTYGYVFQFALKGALKALHCILCLYWGVDIGRGVASDCSPSIKG